MTKKTITKISAFVISVLLGGMLAAACSHDSTSGQARPEFDRKNSPFDEPRIVGKIESNDITESSGLAVSKCQPNVLWTHNDSGDDAFIFAIDATGENLGTWKVTGATNLDWEDIAEIKNADGTCSIYIGDIGNNGKERGQGTIYRVREPSVTPADAGSSRKSPLATQPAESLPFTFDTRNDAETLLVDPATSSIYVLTKRKDKPSEIFKLRPQFGGEAVRAEKVGDIAVPAIMSGLLTGGDISPDGKSVVLCDYVAGYELSLPAGSTKFDDIWKQKPVRIDIGKRDVGEAIAYGTDSNSLFSTSEGKHQPIYEMKRRSVTE
jgi:hypothetical protein